jgi:serine/threonine protein phosphatase PrpC
MDSAFTLKSASVSDRGLSDKRPENEDSFLEINQIGLFAVADGVGGAQAGEVASQMAMEILAEAFANAAPAADAADVMRSAIERSNSAIFQMAHELPQLSRMATTLVALRLDDNIATIAHVGDSRLYRLDPAGDLYRETDDHSMVAEEVRAGRMTAEQAENHPSRNIISRALGAESSVEPEIKTIMIEPRTDFLLCSDGVTRHLTDQEIKGVLTFGGSPVDICDYIKNLCYQRGAEDNLTAVVVKVSGTGAGIAAASSAFELEEAPEESTEVTARSFAVPAFEEEAEEPPTSNFNVEPADLFAPAESTVLKSEESAPIDSPSAEDEVLDLTSPASRAENPAADNTPSTQAQSPELSAPSMPAGSVTTEETSSEPKRSVAGSLLWTLTLLVLGSVIGVTIFYLAVIRPQQAQQALVPPIRDMQSRNPQLTAFEDNRRNVDERPADAIPRLQQFQSEAEDAFLLGRAYLLLGQYVEARQAFLQCRTLLSGGHVEQVNRRTIETEVAIAMAMLNNTSSQANLRSELEQRGISATPAAPPAVLPGPNR